MLEIARLVGARRVIREWWNASRHSQAWGAAS